MGAAQTGQPHVQRTGFHHPGKKHIEHAVSNLLENLTRREYEIALLAGRGESNKGIARQLDIAERTVKAHLTEIFRKLAISDRIKLSPADQGFFCQRQSNRYPRPFRVGMAIAHKRRARKHTGMVHRVGVYLAGCHVLFSR